MKKNRGFQGPPQRQVLNVIQQKLQQALTLHQQGMLSDAKKIYEVILRQNPNHFDALHLLGVIAHQTKNLHQAEELICKAIKVNPNDAAAYSNRGITLRDLKRLDEALASYDKAIVLKPNYAEAYANRGVTLRDLKRLDEALASYDKAIALRPDFAEAYSNRGITLRDLKRLDEALASHCKAIVLKPNYAEAYYNRGIVLQDLKRDDEALASYNRALALSTDYAEAYYNRGNVLRDLQRHDEALASYDKAIALKPSYAEAYNNRGNALRDLKRLDEALTSYDKAIALKPDHANAYNNRANTLKDLKRHYEAVASYDKAIALNPDLFGVKGARLRSKLQLCDWSNLETECAHLNLSVSNNKIHMDPLTFLGISSSPKNQLQCAKSWITEKFPLSQKPIWRGERYHHNRIRIAYVSADFRQHATSFLAAGMFERHNRSRFEITAISIGRDDNSDMRQRLKRSFDHFFDAETLSVKEIASRIKEAEIDILIDLKGFTQDARTDVFAQRPAPVQVNYLGYPGTMGADYIDYIIGDRTVTPDKFWQFYSEKIVVLPDSYQSNDRKRVISDTVLNRSNVGLPSQGFVFCCFNNNYKILPQTFDTWMRILKQIEGSVLWLLEDNASVASNLRKEAAVREISAERLIFANRIPLPEHLARHKLADLFLDTLPYNAHTTASDALWAGLPVLTCLGETFAGRVGASLLNAIRLPELITTTPEAYEQMAIDLASHPEKMAVIKRKLADNRLTTPLFDTALFTKHIEAAYAAMYERYQAGLAPDHIVVPN